MIYASVCSGIEAATVAWEPLGWAPAWFAEIDPFCNSLLGYHYAGVPNLGDIRRITNAKEHGGIDLLVGGTPCQAFSVAGRRGGLDDARGNLTLQYLSLAGRLRPRWVVWENVPGVLSIDGGRTFGAVLGTLGKLGYGCAYRVLDAQYFGVPQRRRRVFVVGYLGDWRRAAAVLLERESLSGHPAPGRAKGKEVAGSLGGGSGSRGWCDDTDRMTFVARCLNAGGCGRIDAESETFVTHSLRADGFDASEDRTGRGTPIIPILEAGARTGKSTDDLRAGMGVGDSGDPMFTLQSGKQHAVAFSSKDHAADAGPLSPTLRAMPHDRTHANAGGQVAVCVQEAQTGVREYDTSGSLRADAPGTQPSGSLLRMGMAVRRLTPRECERLQGFPDDYTLVPYRGKPAADGPRYKALGNSMAVPVMRWIGRRIRMVEDLLA
jgi:DNA (cytosine-5)-methyltransferase 1